MKDSVRAWMLRHPRTKALAISAIEYGQRTRNAVIGAYELGKLIYEDWKFRPYVAKERRCGDLQFDFLISDKTAASWYDTNANQAIPEKLWCRDHLKAGQHAVDCGAHHGMMAVLFSKWVGPTGHVTCYEIVGKNRRIIRKNLDLNGCDNVTIRPFGVADRSGLVRVSRNAGNPNVSSAVVEMKVVSLDHDLGAKKVDFLKIDVEGHELSALKGARRIIHEDHPTICLEIHNFLFSDPLKITQGIFEIISPKTYRFWILPEILGAVAPLGPDALEVLAGYSNPHLFCVPV